MKTGKDVDYWYLSYSDAYSVYKHFQRGGGLPRGMGPLHYELMCMKHHFPVIMNTTPESVKPRKQKKTLKKLLREPLWYLS